MLYFLIICKKKSTSIYNSKELAGFIANGQKLRHNVWTTPDNFLEIHYWLTNNSYFDLCYYEDISGERLRLFNGWINDGNPLNTALKNRDLKKIEESSGEYVYINISRNGDGLLTRNLTSSVQTYYSNDEKATYISNSASLINYLLRPKSSLKDCLDTNFLAWSISTSWAHDDSSLFKGVKVLSQGTKIIIQNYSVHFEKKQGDIWADHHLQELYKKDQQQYWYLCYEKLIDNLNLFFNYFDKPFNFPLSGGKDSRLLLGLILNSEGRSLINKTISNGPPYSGEVVVGRLLTNQLKLEHETNEGGYHGFDMTDRFGKHIFFTEGEVSPMDLTSNFERVSQKMVLRGQEVGLRNISNIKENDFNQIKSWFFKHLGNFNHLGFLKEAYVNERKNEFKHYWLTKNLAENLTDLHTKNRIETRFLRWG